MYASRYLGLGQRLLLVLSHCFAFVSFRAIIYPDMNLHLHMNVESATMNDDSRGLARDLRLIQNTLAGVNS